MVGAPIRGNSGEPRSQISPLLGTEAIAVNTALNQNGWITTSDIAALAAFTIGIPTVEASTFGTDPTGTIDSGPAINAAIAALPVAGGNVYLGTGNFKISTTIVIGNGSASGVSTRSGVRLIGGSCPVGGTRSTGGLYIPGPNPSGGACRLFSGAAVDMLHIKGPLQGWGLENIDFDGASLGLVGLTEVGCTWGVSSGCLIRDFVSAQQMTQSVVNLANHMHNRYTNWAIRVPDVQGCVGIWSRGDGTGTTSNSCYDTWDDLLVAVAPTATHTVNAILLAGCDSLNFRDVHFIVGAVTGTGHTRWIVYDYSAETTAWPTSTHMERVDFGSTGAVLLNVGTPAGSPGANDIVLMANANGTPTNPVLANLNWGVVAANP